MERVTAMEEFFKRNCCIRGYHVCVNEEVHVNVWEAAVGEALKESPEMLPIDTLLLVRAMACNGAHYGSHCNVSTICCRKKSTAENTLRDKISYPYTTQKIFTNENLPIYGIWLLVVSEH